jgi:copper chaperone CopZ
VKTFFLILLLGAAAMAAEPQTSTYRITGLFAPYRAAELRAAVEQIPDVRLVSVDFEHAEATFSYDPAVAFKGVKPANVLKRFDEKLRAESHQNFGLEPAIEIPREQLARVEVRVAGLDCKGCCFAAYESVAKIDGVAQATASFKDGLVTALIDPAKTNREALVEALKQAGVDVKPQNPAVH